MSRLVRAAYRGAMRIVAAAAHVVALVPRWRGLRDRLGRLPPEDRAAAASAPALWLHAASVGELTAARPLLAQLRARFPGRLLFVTTLTRTGLERARALPEVHLATLLPLDAAGPVRALVRALRLELFLFTETEIWPTLLEAITARSVPAVMVSGRVGRRTARRARWLRPLFRRGLARATCCMQTPEDAARVVRLGADPRRVVVAGSLKFDVVDPAPPPELARAGAALDGRPVIVGGSTHAGEEVALCDAFARLAPAHPGLVLVLAPRHPERFAEVAALVRDRGHALVRWPDLVADGATLPAGPVVVLLDVLGVLAHVYAFGTVAFVGGSLVPVGGHNVIEPARLARPVLVGPHTATTGDVVERLLDAGGARRVADVAQLTAALAAVLADPAAARTAGERAAAVVASGRGALERHMKIIAARLGQASHGRETGTT